MRFLIFAAFLGFALGGSFVWGLSYENPHDKRQPQGSQNSYDSKGVSNYASVTQVNAEIECDPNCAAKEPEKYRYEGWPARFVRKSLDDPLAVFTALLALATMALATYTAVVARATKRAAEHIPRVERAYIFADVFFKNVGFGGISTGVVISISNYGKTPGDVYKIAFDFVAAIPPVPDYRGDLAFDIRLKAGVENEMTKIYRTFDQIKGKPIAYGRIYYRDIFGDEHSSGFIRRIMSSQIDIYEGAPPAYTKWD